MTTYVLDTSALLAYVEDEPGADQVEALLASSLEGKAELLASVVTQIEVMYITRKEQGEQKAHERCALIEELPIVLEPLDLGHAETIAAIKATKVMSLADCCIAGLAKLRHAILVHKDPEFELIEGDVEQIKLPYKPTHTESRQLP